MDVILLEDDNWWRREIASALEAAGHRCHTYEGQAFTPAALLAWRQALDVVTPAALVDLNLDFEYDRAHGPASFDTVTAWHEAGLPSRPLFFISGSRPTIGDERRARKLGAVDIVLKKEIDDWGALLDKTARP